MKALVRINQLVPYPLTADDIYDWAMSIERIATGVEPFAISFVIDQYMMGVMEYDKSKGIQNIFTGLKKIEKTEKGYQVIPTHKYQW